MPRDPARRPSPSRRVRGCRAHRGRSAPLDARVGPLDRPRTRRGAGSPSGSLRIWGRTDSRRASSNPASGAAGLSKLVACSWRAAAPRGAQDRARCDRGVNVESGRGPPDRFVRGAMAPGRPSKESARTSGASDGQLGDDERGATEPAWSEYEIRPDTDDRVQKVREVSGDGDPLRWVQAVPALEIVAGRPERELAGHRVDRVKVQERRDGKRMGEAGHERARAVGAGGGE